LESRAGMAPIRRHVVVSRVNKRLLPDLDIEHGCPEHVAGIIGANLKAGFDHDGLLKGAWCHLEHAILDHL